jgi:hypothetical protein
LAENSLVQLHIDGRNTRIDIDEGEVSAVSLSSGGEMILASGDKLAVISPGSVARAGVDNGDFRVRAVEGEVSFTGTGEDETTAREAAAVSPRPAARLLNPGPGKLAVDFQWKRVNLEPEKSVVLELAEDRNFTRMVFREESAGDTISEELEPGSYFWRLFPAGEAAGVSSLDIFPLKVIAAPAPVLIAPVEGYLYQFRVKRPVVRFYWTEVTGADSYLLEVADNPEMQNPALAQESRTASFYAADFGAGTWYWRARPVFSSVYEGEAGEAVPASFSIIQSGNLETPALRKPADREIINIAPGKENVYFSWRSEAEANSYTIRISANPDLRDPLITAMVQNNFYVYRIGENILRPGRYFWAVFQTDVEGNNSSASAVWSFTALEQEAVYRTVFPPDGYTLGSNMLPDIYFTWKTNLPFRIRFQISREAGFSRLEADEPVNGESFRWRALPEGLWYWRIRSQGFNGEVFETPAKSFIIVPPIGAPVPVAPAAEERIVVQEESQTLFSWTASEGAEYYHFKLYHRENPNQPVYENSLFGATSLRLLLEAYPEGAFFWTVQGFASESARSTRRTGHLANSGFSTRKLYLVRLDYPNDGAELDGLQAYYKPDAVRWTKMEETAASRFILSRNRNLTGPPVVSMDNPPQTITLPKLRSGSYYWTIRAETVDGFDISAKAPRRLRILPIPPLPEAENRLPADGTTITGALLKQNRRIAFSWDAVAGATGYLFTLEQGDTGKQIIPEQLTNGTGFALEDLTFLDTGNFVWKLEAVLTEPPGGGAAEIFQRGKIGENRFSLEFALPGVPELRKPGELYGRE